jgi:hypothetical protein
MRTLFVVCWLFIGLISSIDTGLTAHTHTCLKEGEQNPVARAILSQDDWQCGRFLAIKMFCTILVLGFLAALYHHKPKHATIVTTALALFQGLLIIYLLTP